MKPLRNGFAKRFLAGCIDFVVGAIVALLLSSTLGRWFAARAVVMLSIGSPDTFWRGPLPMVLGILGEFVYGLPFALLIVLLAEALFAAGPGKWCLKLHIVGADGSRATPGRLFLRWAVKCSGLWGMALALILGSTAPASAALMAALVILAGFALTLGPGRLALHDRVAGSSVTSITGG